MLKSLRRIFSSLKTGDHASTQNKELPLPPSPLRRALTLPYSSEQHASGQQIAPTPQSQSPFLGQIPLEVRLQIYEYLFPPQTVDIAWPHVRLAPGDQKPGEWYHTICRRDHTTAFWIESCVEDEWKGFHRSGKHRLDISLLYTCRQVYSESISTFYSSVALHFPSVAVLRQFATIVPPQCLARITAVELIWGFKSAEYPHISREAKARYDEVWDTLQAFTGQRRLRVAVSDPDDLPDASERWDFEEAWLSPLDRFSKLEVLNFAIGKPFHVYFEKRLKDGQCQLINTIPPRPSISYFNGHFEWS